MTTIVNHKVVGALPHDPITVGDAIQIAIDAVRNMYGSEDSCVTQAQRNNRAAALHAIKMVDEQFTDMWCPDRQTHILGVILPGGGQP